MLILPSLLHGDKPGFTKIGALRASPQIKDCSIFVLMMRLPVDRNPHVGPKF